MKIKEGFLLRTIAGQHVVVPTGQHLDLSLMITLNETGAFLWEKLQVETTKNALVDALLSEYNVNKKTALNDVMTFIHKLSDNQLLE